jgi:hypothetical protein
LRLHPVIVGLFPDVASPHQTPQSYQCAANLPA